MSARGRVGAGWRADRRDNARASPGDDASLPCLCLVRQTVHHTASCLSRDGSSPSPRELRAARKNVGTPSPLLLSLSLSLPRSLILFMTTTTWEWDYTTRGPRSRQTSSPARERCTRPCSWLQACTARRELAIRTRHRSLADGVLDHSVVWTPRLRRQAGRRLMPGAPTLDHPPPHDSATQDRTQRIGPT